MREPNQQDALLYLNLARYQHEKGFQDAEAYMFSDDFPLTFESNERERSEGKLDLKLLYTYIGIIDMIGTFYSQGLIQEDILFRLNTFEWEWERFGEVIQGYREKNGASGFMLGLEQLAEGEKKYRANKAKK